MFNFVHKSMYILTKVPEQSLEEHRTAHLRTMNKLQKNEYNKVCCKVK
jgi:hypothetical protein